MPSIPQYARVSCSYPFRCEAASQAEYARCTEHGKRHTAEPPYLDPRVVFIFLFGLATMGKPVSAISMLSLLSALLALLVTYDPGIQHEPR